MNNKKVIFLSVLLGIGFFVGLMAAPTLLELDLAFAAVEVPSYASSGNADSQLEDSGQALTEWLSSAAVVVLIAGIIWGAMTLGGDPEGGKQKILYSVVGLVVVAMSFGVAKLALAY
jgi:hypothetical protein